MLLVHVSSKTNNILLWPVEGLLMVQLHRSGNDGCFIHCVGLKSAFALGSLRNKVTFL